MRALLAAVREHAAAFLICSLFFGAGVFRLNDLCLYTPDSARYLIWGNSLAHGQGFLDTSEPDVDRVVLHAPLYPVLLAPVEAVFPLSLTAAKVWTLLWGVAALALLYRWLTFLAGRRAAAAGTFLLAANPLMLLYSSEVLSEAPFIVFMLVIMLACERMTDGGKSRLVFPVLLVFSAAAALLREAGAAVLAATAVFLFMRRRPGPALIVLAAASAAALGWYLRNQHWIALSPGTQGGNVSLVFQHFVTAPGSSMVKEFVMRIWLNVSHYGMQLGGMILYPLFSTHQVNLMVNPSPYYELFRDAYTVLKYFVVAAAAPAMAAGLVYDIRSSPSASIRLLVALGYLAAVAAYPIHDIRFLVPIIPILIMYLVRGGQAIVRIPALPGLAGMKRFAMPLALLLMIPNLGGIHQILATNAEYRRSPVQFFASIREMPGYPAIFAQTWSVMGAWVRQHIGNDAIIASPTKDIALFVEERKVLELDPGVTQPLFESLLRDNRVGYILSPVRWADFGAFDFQMSESRRFRFEHLFGAGNLHLYRVVSRFQDRAAPAWVEDSEPDSTTATGLMRLGRRYLMEEKLDSAAAALDAAEALAPLQPVVVYQAILPHAFAGDTGAALVRYRKLMTLPQAASYMFLARAQIQAADVFAGAKSATEDMERSVQTWEAASRYWSLGYPLRAYRLMKESLRNDTTYFNGLLWGFHFSIQAGDTANGETYLKRLQAIDSANPIVKAFGRLLEIGDSLSAAPAPAEESRLHLAVARLYFQIELNEEAIDECELSLAADNRNTEALRLLAQLFGRKSRGRASEEMYRRAYAADASDAAALASADSLRALRQVQ